MYIVSFTSHSGALAQNGPFRKSCIFLQPPFLWWMTFQNFPLLRFPRGFEKKPASLELQRT